MFKKSKKDAAPVAESAAEKVEEAPAKSYAVKHADPVGDYITSPEYAKGLVRDRRERIAVAIASGIAASPLHTGMVQADYERLAKDAVRAADAVIAELDKVQA